MKKTVLILAITAAFAGCKSKTADNSASSVNVPPPPPPTVLKVDTISTAAAVVVMKADTMCFQYNFKKDVSVVKLILAGDNASGDYHWHPYEKDGGHGTFKGKKTGNMIHADWTYMIEGSTQTQEVVFKMAGDKLMVGDGELVEKGTKLVYKNAEKLKFTDVYKKVDCKTMKID